MPHRHAPVPPVSATPACGLAAAIAVCLWMPTAAAGPKAPGPALAGGFHISYEWTERTGDISLRREVHLYGTGQVRFVLRTGLGGAKEFTPPRDRQLAALAAKGLSGAALPPPPCGAPRGGVLVFRKTGKRPKRIVLYDPNQWRRYGGLVERLLAGALRLRYPPSQDGCRPLLTGLAPGRLGRLWRPPESSVGEGKVLKELVESRDPDRRFDALAKLAWKKGGDPFFRFELLRRHATRRAARQLIEAGLPDTARQARGPDQVRILLDRLQGNRTPDALFHTALLEAALGRYAAAAGHLEAFWRSMAPEKQFRKMKRRLVAIRAAVAASASDRVPWGRAKRAHAALFGFLNRLLTWAGLTPQEHGLCPLGRLLARRALHEVRKAFFSRGPSVHGRPAVEARAFLLEYYPVLAQGDWRDLEPAWANDLMLLTGYLRRNRGLYRNTHFAGPVSVRDSLVQLIRLRRYRTARRFLDRRAGAASEVRISLLLAAGRALRDQERWKDALEAFDEAAKLGSSRALAERLRTFAIQGRLSRLQTLLDTVGPALPDEAAREFRIRLALAARDVKRAVHTAAEILGGARSTWGLLAAGTAFARAGRTDRAVRALKSACLSAKGPWRAACAQLGRLAVMASGGRIGTARAALSKAGLPGCAHAVQAAAASRSGRREAAVLLARRAEFHALGRGADIWCAAQVLATARATMPHAFRLVTWLLVRRPDWSPAHALAARLLLDGGRPHRALAHAMAALRRKPWDAAYRKLAAAAMRASRTHGLTRVEEGLKGTRP